MLVKKKIISSLLTTALLIGQLFLSHNTATAEDCPNRDLTKVFGEEFFPDIKWDTTTKPRVITWSYNTNTVSNVAIARQFKTEEIGWLQVAFDSWDLALDSINFQKVDDATTANVLIGLTPLQNNGFWTVETTTTEDGAKIRVRGTIRVSSTTPIILTREGFIEVVQSEIGNLLGLGDIRGEFGEDSVMADPDTPPFGEPVLNDLDISLIRQFYGESTCKSSWSPALVKAKEDWVIAQKKNLEAKQAEVDAKALADARARAEAQAKIQSQEEAAARATLRLPANKKTITCVKGATKKKVTAVKPVCPKGFKRK